MRKSVSGLTLNQNCPVLLNNIIKLTTPKEILFDFNSWRWSLYKKTDQSFQPLAWRLHTPSVTLMCLWLLSLLRDSWISETRNIFIYSYIVKKETLSYDLTHWEIQLQLEFVNFCFTQNKKLKQCSCLETIILILNASTTNCNAKQITN